MKRKASESRWHLMVISLCISSLAFAQGATANTGQGAGWTDNHNGQFTTSIPIKVPAFHGLEPKLSLAYTSGGPNSLVGVGWSLTGLSKIERASPGKGSPAYTSSDIFLLDGEQLIPCTSTSTSPSCTTAPSNGVPGYYSTKRESYRRIQGVGVTNGEGAWYIWDKDGTKSTYGATYGVYINSAWYGFRYGIESVQDAVGNTVTTTWQANTLFGNACCWDWPQSISYNGYKITFNYQPRSDYQTFATGISLNVNFGIINNITETQGSNNIRAYQLTYTTSGSTSRSMLSSVQEYGRDYVCTPDGDGQCVLTKNTALPATTLTYQAGVNGFSSSNWYFLGFSDANGWGYPNVPIGYADVNGDGLTDACGRASTGIYCALGATSGNPTYTQWTPGYGSPGWDAAQNYSTIRYPDLNGDGKADVCGKASDGLYCALSNGSSFGAMTQWSASYGDNSGWGADAYYYDTIQYLDLNGDGLTDVCGRASSGIYCALSNGSSFGAMTQWSAGFTDASSWAADPSYWSTISYPDLNGDGLPDICGRSSYGLVCGLSTGSSFGQINQWDTYLSDASGWMANYYYQTIAYADINGDGKADVCGRASDGIHCELSNGDNFAGPTNWIANFTDASGWGSDPSYYTTIRYVDVNGDGMADVCGRSSAGMLCAVSNGNFAFTGLTVWSDFTNAEGWTSPLYYPYISFGNFTGNSKTDICSRASGGIYCHAAASPTTDLLATITRPEGGVATVSYGSASAYGNNYPSTTPVVTSVTMNDQVMPVATTTYTYSGWKFDNVNREPLGFAYVWETLPLIAGDSASTPPTRILEYQQDYACAGKPYSDYVTLGGSATTSPTSYLSASFMTYTAVQSAPYTCLETTHREVAYDPTNSGNSKTHQLAYAYDAYGNVTQTKDYGDINIPGHQKETDSLYYPNATSYIVGLQASALVSSATWNGTTWAKGGVLAQTLSYYDGASSSTTAPTAGLLTRTDRLIGGATYATTTSKYDTFGNVTASADSLGNTTKSVYDGTFHSFPTSTTNALNQTTTRSFDYAQQVPTSVVDANNQTTTLGYDALGRLISSAAAMGLSETYSYFTWGTGNNLWATQVTKPSANGTCGTWQSTYKNGFGKDIYLYARGPNWSCSTGGQYIVAKNVTFDARGNIANSYLPYYSDASSKPYDTFNYDGLNRVIKLTHADGTASARGYNLSSNVWTSTATDELGHQILSSYDAFGQLTRHSELHNGSWYATTYAYDLLGDETLTTDSQGNASTTYYDGLGRVTKQVDPDLGTWRFSYDAANQLTSQVDALNHTTTLAYDALGRVTAKNANGTTASWAYDQGGAAANTVGRLTTTNDAAGKETYAYDLLGRLTQHVRSIDSVNYTFKYGFDAGGRKLWTTYPDGDTLGTSASPLTYDGAGRLSSIPGLVSSITYNADGSQSAVTNGNGTTTTYSYDVNRHWLKNISTVKGTTTLQGLTYTKDGEGKVTATTSACNTASCGASYESWTYAYDDLHQLTQATNVGNSAYSVASGYNEIGNVISNSRGGASYTYPAAGSARPHAVTAAGGSAYAYDANGNMTSRAGTAITFDGNNLATAIGGTSFVYDALGSRLKKVASGVTTRFIGDAYEVNASTGVTTKYLGFAKRVSTTGPGCTTAPCTYWLHLDGQGSINVVTNSTGTEQLRRAYYPFGETLYSSTSFTESRGYTGQRLDPETGLLYLHARYMDPKLGRFISADTIVDGPTAIGLNRYAYTHNGPTNATDSGGHASASSEAATVVAATSFSATAAGCTMAPPLCPIIGAAGVAAYVTAEVVGNFSALSHFVGCDILGNCGSKPKLVWQKPVLHSVSSSDRTTQLEADDGTTPFTSVLDTWGTEGSHRYLRRTFIREVATRYIINGHEVSQAYYNKYIQQTGDAEVSTTSSFSYGTSNWFWDSHYDAEEQDTYGGFQVTFTVRPRTEARHEEQPRANTTVNSGKLQATTTVYPTSPVPTQVNQQALQTGGKLTAVIFDDTPAAGSPGSYSPRNSQSPINHRMGAPAWRELVHHADQESASREKMPSGWLVNNGELAAREAEKAI